MEVSYSWQGRKTQNNCGNVMKNAVPVEKNNGGIEVLTDEVKGFTN